MHCTQTKNCNKVKLYPLYPWLQNVFIVACFHAVSATGCWTTSTWDGPANLWISAAVSSVFKVLHGTIVACWRLVHIFVADYLTVISVLLWCLKSIWHGKRTRVFVGLSCKNKTESKILRVFLQYIVQVAAIQEFWESVFNGFMVISSNGQLDISTLLSGVKCESGESLSCILTSGTFVIWLWNTFVIFRAWKYIIDPGKRSLAKQQRTNSRSTVYLLSSFCYHITFISRLLDESCNLKHLHYFTWADLIC